MNCKDGRITRLRTGGTLPGIWIHKDKRLGISPVVSSRPTLEWSLNPSYTIPLDWRIEPSRVFKHIQDRASASPEHASFDRVLAFAIELTKAVQAFFAGRLDAALVLATKAATISDDLQMSAINTFLAAPHPPSPGAHG